MSSANPITSCVEEALHPQVASATAAPIVYLVHREGLGPVFSSQVVQPLARLVERGYDVRLGVFVPLGHVLRRGPRRRWTELLGAVEQTALRGRVSRLPSPPTRARWAWNEARVLSAWMRLRYGKTRRLIVHCRNAQTTSLALRVRRGLPAARVIFDCRGISRAEYLYELGHARGCVDDEAARREADRLAGIEAAAAQQADAVLCVSRAMAGYVQREYGVPANKISVVPCCVDANRFAEAAECRPAIRRELGLADRFVVAYCGSLHRWQLPERCFDLFEQIRRFEPSAHLLAITTGPETMQRLLRERGIDGEATVVSLPHHEVPRYLAAADVGLLLREASLVNRVASPVKFAEYLASGTPVILSDEIGDYSDLARRERLGVVLPHKAADDTVDGLVNGFLRGYLRDTEAMRQRCRKIAQEHLDTSVHLPKREALYEWLSESGG